MDDKAATNWYGIRTVYHFGRKKDGTNVFEERTVVFSGADVDEAFEKATREADAYASGGKKPMEVHPVMEAYHQDGDALIDGYEVWSQLYESSEDLETFFQSRYENYTYHADR